MIVQNKIDGLSRIENNLEKININYSKKFSSKSYKPQIILHLPKFKIESTIDLAEALKQVIF